MIYVILIKFNVYAFMLNYIYYYRQERKNEILINLKIWNYQYLKLF